jgi:hypothetical protein
VVERYALATRADDTLLELKVGFGIESALKAQGWEVNLPGLVNGRRFIRASRARSRLEVFYQHTPRELDSRSHYGQIQRDHAFTNIGLLRPDFIFREVTSSGERWLLVEVKGVQRAVDRSARAATLDLLAYRRAFDASLSDNCTPYGLGVAWGAELTPSASPEIMLCSPDTLPQALELIFG